MILKDAPEGFQPTEIGLIPVDWKLKQAKDISGCIVPGRNKPKKFDGIIPWVTTSDIDKLGKIDNSKISLFISKEEANAIGSRVVPANAVIISCVGELGVVCVAENEIVINQQLHAFLPNSKINSKYLSYILSSLKEYFYSKATKTTLPYLNKDNCNSTPIPLPCIEEQTAIANALSDVDALLTELEMLITKKQAIKTATMQQLLTGKTRLPQFATYTEGTVEGKRKGTKPSELGEIPEDWDVSNIGSVLSITTGSRNTQDKLSDGQYPFFVRSQTIERINTYSFDGEAVLTAGDGVGTGKIFHYMNGKFDYHQRVYLMHNFGDRIDGYYFYIYFSNFFYDRIMSMTAKSSVDSVRREMIADMLITLPSKEEQAAIATILSDMDNEIQTLEQRLTKTRQIKQGMMQQLLTGRTRLPY